MTDLMNVEEAAEFMHRRPSTIRDWILNRKIDYCKLHGGVFLRRSDLEKMIAESVVPAQHEPIFGKTGRRSER